MTLAEARPAKRRCALTLEDELHYQVQDLEKEDHIAVQQTPNISEMLQLGALDEDLNEDDVQFALDQESSTEDNAEQLDDDFGDVFDGDISDVELNARLELAMEEYIGKIMQGLGTDALAATKHGLPLARIKRIMKQDACENPRMIGADATPCLAVACHLFVGIIAVRSWAICSRESRHTVQVRDVVAAFQTDQQFDFLLDVIEQFKSERSSKDAATT